jgi:hypothetical protein
MGKIRKALQRAQVKLYPDPSLSANITPFGHRYPWQLYTRQNDVQLTARLPQTFPVDDLQKELAAVLANQQFQDQFGPYHFGGWTAVALNSVDGNPLDQDDPFDDEFQKTEALKHAPLMEEIIDSLPGEKRRVRLMRLEPGRQIFWHKDFWHSYDYRLLRLHIPITTNDKVAFQISHQDCPWQPGEFWYGDFTFPHRLQNGGDADRVHLVIDVINNDELRAMVPGRLQEQYELRTQARQRSEKLLRYYNIAFATNQRLKAKKEARLKVEENAKQP